MELVYLLIPLACLGAAVAVGFLGSVVGRVAAHTIAIAGVAISFLLSIIVAVDVSQGHHFNGAIYTWGQSGGVVFTVGFLIDELTAVMMVVVTFVSLMVHVYTIGYMAKDPGYTRFFSYIGLFTFAMLMLVMANNFLQLFFGWEAVGLVSYLLIGFWYERESAIFANLKAFLVNRVGDLGFLLGIAGVLFLFGSLDYATVFEAAPQKETATLVSPMGYEWQWITLICLLLFVGAMGKSAQVPLHVWLPDSMEGPTPISALIHAATMVTAGIFMVARMSPLFELSETARSVVLMIGALTALLMALVGLVQTDIKRVVAYSTLSQLGYMTVALGASAYSIAIFHLTTHAFFKALLFLGAGAVIIALHHEQDMRKMGGLRRALPITYGTCIVGSLALSGIPPFSGFFSKDAIIEAVAHATIPGAGLTYVAVLIGVFVTALYSFRLIFMVFHGQRAENLDEAHGVNEPGWVVTFPLIALAIPSVVAGAILVEPVLSGRLFATAITEPVIATGSHTTAGTMLLHGFSGLPFWLAVAGVISAWVLYCLKPRWPSKIASTFSPVYRILQRKYGFDELYQCVFMRGSRYLGEHLWRTGDVKLIDGIMVNGTANLVGRLAEIIRHLQSGYIYHYAFAMIIGLVVAMSWHLWV
ncbi:MAG TPA: NADH-quinone oxidoreductase subunit L [Gammaproteobacteria bacterium]|nr:NADH-quinone oxidoreductase subunit L [Gammaproteobacteria bacterium]HIL17738.1 NADH-quinone oxidoreductase subunit L [Gammaproteobacteria bacterium]